MSYLPQPYIIHVPGDKIERLKQKLALADFPHDAADFDGNSWDLGPPVEEIRRLARFWQTEYDWRKAESQLNDMPQFTVPITCDDLGQTFTIHFVHQRSTNRHSAIPLLFLHGWPGNFIEVSKIIDRLTCTTDEDKSSPVFHVVAPSLVDFGFSSRSTKGFRFKHHAEIYHKLMLTLGYDRYVIQSGDIGSLVSRFMAKQFGSSGLVACHTNTPWPLEPTEESHPELYTKCQAEPPSEAEKDSLVKTMRFVSEGRGYSSIMSTRPTTVGYAFQDSPIALLAWIYEKLHSWSDGYPWSDDEILTWVSVHYFSTPGPEAPSNAYYAIDHDEPPAFVTAAAYSDVPLGLSRFGNDLVLFPKLWHHTLSPIVFQNEHARGGHFAAWEQPDAIVDDMRAMFRTDGLLGDVHKTCE